MLFPSPLLISHPVLPSHYTSLLPFYFFGFRMPARSIASTIAPITILLKQPTSNIAFISLLYITPTFPLLYISTISYFLCFCPANEVFFTKTLNFAKAKPKLDWQLREAEQKAVLEMNGLPAKSHN